MEIRLILAVLGAAAVALGVWGFGTVQGRLRAPRRRVWAPAARPTAVVPYHAARGRSGRAVLQLAWIEGRRTAIHPALLSLGSMGVLAGLPFLFSSSDVSWMLGGLAWMLALGGLIAANLGALRSRRERTEELFSSMPVTVSARTSAFAVSAWVPASATGTLLFLLALRPGLEFRDGSPAFASVDLWQLPVLVGTLCVLGVVLARWIPSPLAAPVIAVGFFAFLGQVFQGGAVRARVALADDNRPQRVVRPPRVAHRLRGRGGLALGALAVLRSGGRWRAAALSLIAGGALAVGAGIIQVAAA